MGWKNVCKCQSVKEKAQIQDIELKASTCTALASVNVQGLESGSTRQDTRPMLSSPALTADSVSAGLARKLIDSSTCIRIWGDRPYQAVEDNAAAARAHWRSVCDLRNNNEESEPPAETDAPSRVLQSIQSLNPGAGPGLPAHLPVSIKSLASRAVIKCATGARFLLFLTADGLVYSMGIGKRGELGLGDKLTMVRTPFPIEFQLPPRPTNAEHHKTPHLAGSLEDMGGFNLTKSVAPTIPPTLSLQSMPRSESDLSFSSNTIRIADIACGEEHALALGVDGRLWMWGNRDYLGLRTCTDMSRPTLLTDEFFLVKEANADNEVGPSPLVATIGAGPKASVVVTRTGRVLMWGRLPGGHTAVSPELVATIPETGIRKIVMGQSAGLMLSDQGIVLQFGIGTQGEILDGDELRRLSAQETKRTEDSHSDTSITARGSVTVIQKVPRRLTYLVPEPLAALVNAFGDPIPTIRDMAMGDHHVLLLATDGIVYAYGDNNWGQCGTGALKQIVTVPTAVNLAMNPSGPPPRVTHVSAGGRQSGIITARGHVFLWGCTSDYRLITDAVRELVDYPMQAFLSGPDAILSQVRPARMGVSTVAGIHNSKYLPQSVPVLAPFLVTGLTMGSSYTVVITGRPETASSRSATDIEYSTPEQLSQRPRSRTLHYSSASPEPGIH